MTSEHIHTCLPITISLAGLIRLCESSFKNIACESPLIIDIPLENIQSSPIFIECPSVAMIQTPSVVKPSWISMHDSASRV